MFQLSSLEKAGKKRKRIGRGGSRGGTSGRGTKGQKARTGDAGVGYGFEGGQTPLSRHLPKRGFSNKKFSRPRVILNIKDLELNFKEGEEVTVDILVKKGVISLAKGTPNPLVKLLGMGNLTKRLVVTLEEVSATAREAIERVGGKVMH